MATCYDCGERIIGGTAHRMPVQTGFSMGQRSSRVYYRNVLLCADCADIRRRQDERAKRSCQIIGGVVLAFFGTAWLIGRNSLSSHHYSAKNLAPSPAPTISSLPGRVETASTEQSQADMQAIPSPTVEPSEPTSTFLVRANDGYANLRSSPSTESISLAKIANGTSVEILVLYRKRHGTSPIKRAVEGTTQTVNVYGQADLDLLDEAIRTVMETR